MKDRLKEIRLGEIAAIAVFMAGLLAFYSFGDSIATWGISSNLRAFVLLFALYLGAQFLAAIIDFLQGRHRLTPKNFIILWSSYLFVTMVNLLFLVALFPLIILQFILGPATFFVFFISSATLLIYFVQNTLGIDWVGNPPTIETAKWALVGLAACFGAIGLVYYWNSKEINPETLLIDFWLDKIDTPARKLHQKWMRFLEV
ncbi:MAG: hypothetical protein AB8B69_10365 [Chitinophagales bacterium]